MIPAYICKHCLESESEHASYGEWCPMYSEDGHFTAWDKSHKFERVAVKELLQQVAELTKENERKGDLLYALGVKKVELDNKVEALAEQLEREKTAGDEAVKTHWLTIQKQAIQLNELEAENERLKDLMGVEHCPSLADCCRESTELDRLRAERKELVEALRELYKQQPTMLTLIPDAALDFLDLPKKATLLKVESLLSKFEVPNQSKT